MVAIKDALSSFANDMYSCLIKEGGNCQKNIFMSPISVYAALALTLAGSDGNTKLELLKALHLPAGITHNDSCKSVGEALAEYLKSTEFVTITCANRLFTEEKCKTKDLYKQLITKHYKADIETIGFASSAETARQRINQWVYEVTKNKIVDLLPCGSITTDTVNVLVNAVYFKGLWQKAFCPTDTVKDHFIKHDGTKVEVDMMHRLEQYAHVKLESYNAHAVKLPFRDSNWELLIILPDRESDLVTLIKQLSKPNAMATVLSEMFKCEEVNLYLPRFSLKSLDPIDMVQLLRKMGIVDLFDELRADLTQMCEHIRTHVSSIHHKAVLEVDEEGAVAVAATAVVCVNYCAITDERDPPKIKVDRPFFIALVCDGKIPMFCGHVTEPESCNK